MDGTPLRRRLAASEVPGTYTLADTTFVPYRPRSTAEAEQLGWYRSAGGKSYTVFYWKEAKVFTVHNENLEPATSRTFTTQQHAMNYIRTLDADATVKAVLPERTTTWLFSQSIDGHGGVDAWGGDRARLEHRGDWIRLKGPKDYGGKYSVTFVWEKGDAAMPADFDLELKPGERRTIQNTEGAGVYYNVDVICNGPLYTYYGQQAEEEAPGLEDQVPTPAPSYLFNGPIMQRVRALIASRRGTA